MVDTHGPGEKRPVRAPVDQRGAVDLLLAQTRHGRNALGRVLREVRLKLIEAGRVGLDVVLVDQPGPDQDVGHAVEQGDIGAGLEGQVQVRHPGRLADARVRDHDRLAGIPLEAVAENRVIVGDVRANQEDRVGLLEVFVRPGRSITAERSLVARHRTGHAESRVAVVVVCAETQLHQFAECVELLGHQLPCAHHAQGARPVLRLHLAELLHKGSDGVIPCDALEAALLVLEQRVARSARGRDYLVFRQTLRA